MLFGNLNIISTHNYLMTHAAFRPALQWLRGMPSSPVPGIYEIDGPRYYVNVHGYDTLAREACAFESHRHFVDLQYCISGGELIDVCWRHRLTEAAPYDDAKDFQFYAAPDRFSSLRIEAGDFAVFFPDDAHRPKVSDGRNGAITKLVIKIHTDYFSKP
jgi:YhcH/YjgK/YiaL family protein